MTLKLIDTRKINRGQIGFVIKEIYEIGDYKVVTDKYDFGYMRVNIIKNGNKYLPSIYGEYDLEECNLYKFTIQTTSYGSLDTNEIKEVIKGFEYAIKVVEILTEKFISK